MATLGEIWSLAISMFYTSVFLTLYFAWLPVRDLFGCHRWDPRRGSYAWSQLMSSHRKTRDKSVTRPGEAQVIRILL